MLGMTKEEVSAYNLALDEIDKEINFLSEHFSCQIPGYELGRLAAASRAMRDATLDERDY